jgi:GMP synthase-like glutamine amidotransferase
MEVGVLDMYPDSLGCFHIIKTLLDIGCSPVVFHMKNIIKNKENLGKIIRTSGIKHWIFSGSPQSVLDKRSIQIPLKALTFPDIEYLLICYSMESVLKQTGHIVIQRDENIKENFRLHIQHTKAIIHNKEYLFRGVKTPLYAWRNHRGFTPAIKCDDLTELASYRGELMIAFYKKLLFMQFHPERTHDGKKIIANWLGGNKIYK